jgi:hypothetical protein
MLKKKISKIILNGLTDNLFKSKYSEHLIEKKYSQSIDINTKKIIPSYTELIHNGKILTKEEKNAIINEAKFFESDELLQTLLNDVDYVGHKKLYSDSTNEYDLYFAKGILFAVQVLKLKIAKLANKKLES